MILNSVFSDSYIYIYTCIYVCARYISYLPALSYEKGLELLDKAFTRMGALKKGP